MLIMAERVNHPPHYNAGGIECIDALEAATSGLQGIEAFCTANAIKYLWRWKLKNGEEDLQKAVWYINRLIQRAGADSAAGKELFNMKENKHGFEPKQEFTMGGIAWTVIQTGADWVKCIASDCVEERAFDEENKNDFAASSLRAYLNGEFLRRLIKAGAPEEMFEYFNIDLTADDGEELRRRSRPDRAYHLRGIPPFARQHSGASGSLVVDGYTGQPDKFFRPQRLFGRLFELTTRTTAAMAFARFAISNLKSWYRT